MFRNGFIFRLIGVLLLIGLVGAGGFMAFKAGETQGIAQAPAVATAISEAAENGQGVPPMAYGPAYGYGYHPYSFGYRHHFGFFPLGGICFSIFFLFLFFGVLRMVFFRTWRHACGHHGPWGRHWEGGVPPMFSEWHKRAHDEKSAEEGDKKE
ncbi:MAG TPA: hypothetical protein VJL10_07810 [Anaerolineales bacterium]|nr:hypothetical protein [Anaerolineales bacterium]